MTRANDSSTEHQTCPKRDRYGNWRRIRRSGSQGSPPFVAASEGVIGNDTGLVESVPSSTPSNGFEAVRRGPSEGERVSGRLHDRRIIDAEREATDTAPRQFVSLRFVPISIEATRSDIRRREARGIPGTSPCRKRNYLLAFLLHLLQMDRGAPQAVQRAPPAPCRAQGRLGAAGARIPIDDLDTDCMSISLLADLPLGTRVRSRSRRKVWSSESSRTIHKDMFIN